MQLLIGCPVKGLFFYGVFVGPVRPLGFGHAAYQVTPYTVIVIND